MGDAGMRDRDRSLTSRGLEDACALGQLIAKEKWSIDKVLSSTSQRTHQTIEAINMALQPPLTVDYLDMLYLAGVGDLFHVLHMLPNNLQQVVLVGHNPGLHQLCLTLSHDGDPEAVAETELSFSPCGVAVIDCDIPYWRDMAPAVGFLTRYINRHHVADMLEQR